MATFHVYVEGADDATPAGIRRTAQAISQRFGLGTDDLVKRLGTGRFRVKANVDRVTGESYVRALTECGARAVLEASEGTGVAAVEPRKTSSGSMPPINTARKASPSTPPPPTARPSTPSMPPAVRAASSSLPPANRPSSSSIPPLTQARTTSKNNMASGLSAAFEGSGRAQSESEFSALGDGALSLASLDGADGGEAHEQFAPVQKFEPPAPVAAPTAKSTGKSAPVQAPVDLFRPPDAEEAEQLVDLAADEVAEREKKAARARRPSVAPTAVPGMPTLAPTPQRFGRVETPATVVPQKDPAPRGRFIAGVVLAILVGFIPAHVVAAAREKSAFAAIDAQIVRVQNDADDQDSYNALDGFRANQLQHKKDERRSIAMMALAIWAVAGAAVAYGFFYRVPWDKLGKPPAPTT